MHPVDGQAEADHGEAGEDSDEDGKNQEKNFFVEDAFESGKQALGNVNASDRTGRRRRRLRSKDCGGEVAHWLAASRFWEIRSSARSRPWGGPQMAAVCCSIWKTTSMIASGRSVSAGESQAIQIRLGGEPAGLQAGKQILRWLSGCGGSGCAEAGGVEDRLRPGGRIHSAAAQPGRKRASMRRLRSASEIWLRKGFVRRISSVVTRSWRMLAILRIRIRWPPEDNAAPVT